MDVNTLHEHSSNHRAAVEASASAYCFFCLCQFPPSKIVEWTDDGCTAICPACGVDAILPEMPGMTPRVLADMFKHWFGIPIEEDR